MSTDCPFFATGRIQRPELFIGRNYELTFIMHRMTGQQPTSINIYGARRIGKSSLLYHFYLTWQNRIKPEERQKFAVTYMSMAQVKTEEEFYQQLAKIWRDYAPLQKNTAWQKIWHASSWTRSSFNNALKACQETVKTLLVVGLDDIETILRHAQNFDDGFYDNLRSVMGNNQLMLVIASLEPLKDYKHRYGLISMFFNQGQTLELKELETSEAETLLLWADKADFNPQQKKKMRAWGKKHPYLLQLAGVCLWEAQEAGKNEQFAQQQFEKDKELNLSSAPLPRPRGFAKFLIPFQQLGRLADWFAEKWHHLHLAVIGIVIVVAVALILLSGTYWSFIHLAEHPFEFFKQIWIFFFGGSMEGH